MKTLLLIISNFWKNSSRKQKLLVSIILGLIIFAGYISVQKGVYKYKYFKEIERRYQTAKDSINALNIRVKELSRHQKIKTENIQKQSTLINDKLKKDEEIIDNTPVADDELDAYIAKHEKG